jgi:hypothetical protein
MSQMTYRNKPKSVLSGTGSQNVEIGFEPAEERSSKRSYPVNTQTILQASCGARATCARRAEPKFRAAQLHGEIIDLVAGVGFEPTTFGL